MARKNKDIEILVKLASQGNFDEAQKQLERLKAGQESAATGGAGAIGKLQGAWKAWTNTAQVSAGKIRAAFLTALGPIGAIIVIVETVIRTFATLIRFATNYQKAQEAVNKTFADAEAAIEAARKSKEKYADATGVESLGQAIKAHEVDLRAILKSHDEIAKKIAEQKESFFGTLFTLASTTIRYQEQLALLTAQKQEVEAQALAKQNQLETEKELARAAKEREAAEISIADRLAKLTLDDTAFKQRELEKQIAAYEKAGADKVTLDQLRAAEVASIIEEGARKREEVDQQLASRVAQMTLDEIDLQRMKLEAEVSAYEKAGADKTLIDEFRASESKRIGDLETKHKEDRAKKEATIDKARAEAGKQFLNDLAAFQNSKNKEMAAVGKAAAMTSNLIATMEGATKAFNALSGIPVVGPFLGTAAAAAAVAAGTARGAVIAGVELEGGGVAEKEMIAKIGEKGRAEGVLPLKDPRAMKMVGEAISDAGGAGGGGNTFYNTFLLPGLEAARDPETARAILEILADQMERGSSPAARRAAVTLVRRAEADQDMAV